MCRVRTDSSKQYPTSQVSPYHCPPTLTFRRAAGYRCGSCPACPGRSVCLARYCRARVRADFCMERASGCLCGGMRHTRPRVQLEVRVRGSSSLAPTARSLISEQPRLLVQSSLFNTKKAGKCQPSTSWSARAAATRPRRSRRQPQGQPAASWRVHPRVHHHPEEAELGAP